MTAEQYKVLVTCAVFEPGFRGGGLIRSVAGIIDTVPDGIDVSMVTRDRDLGSSEPYPWLSGRWITEPGPGCSIWRRGSPAIWLLLWRELRSVRFDLLRVLVARGRERPVLALKP
jgi:hypothetical protein